METTQNKAVSETANEPTNNEIAENGQVSNPNLPDPVEPGSEEQEAPEPQAPAEALSDEERAANYLVNFKKASENDKYFAFNQVSQTIANLEAVKKKTDHTKAEIKYWNSVLAKMKSYME